MRKKTLQFRSYIRYLLAAGVALLLALAGLAASGLNTQAVAAGGPDCSTAQSPKWKIHEGVTLEASFDNAGVNYIDGLDTDMKARAFVQWSLLREDGTSNSAYVFTPYVSYLKPGTDEWSTPQEMKPENPGGLPKFLPPVKALDKTKDGWPATVKITLKRKDGVCQIPEADASRIFEVPGGELVRDAEVMSINSQYAEGEDPSNAGNDTFRNNKGDLIYLNPKTGVNPEAKSKALLKENKVAYVLWVEGKCADVAAEGAKCNDITYQNKPYAEIEILKYKNYVNELLKYIDGQTSPIAYYGSKPRWGYAYMGSVKDNLIYGYGPKKGQPVEYVSNMSRILPFCYDGPCLDRYWRGNIEPKKPTAVDAKGADNDVLQLPDDSRISYYVVPESGKITSQNVVSGEKKITDIAKYVDGKATVKVRAHVRGVCNVENLTSSKTSNEYSIDNSYCGFREWEFTFYGTQKVQLTPPTFDDATGTYEIPNIPGVKWQIDGKEVTPGTHKYPNKHGKISITAVPGTPNDPNVPIELVGNPGPHEHEYDLRTSATPPVPTVKDAEGEGTWSTVVLPNDPSGFFSYGEPTYVDNSGKPFVEGTSKVVDGKQGVVRVKLTDAGLVEHNKLLCPAGADCKVISDTELEFKVPLTYLKKTVEPVVPTVVKAAECGTPGTVNIPESEFFSYTQTATGTKVHVVAKLKDADLYRLPAGAKTEWDLDIAGRLCLIDPVTPNPGPVGPGEMVKPFATPKAPTVQAAAKCGTPGTVNIPESSVFTYESKETGTNVHVTAKLKDPARYQLAAGVKTEWDLDIAGKACVDATPEAPTVTPAATCGKPGTLNIPDSEFFDYNKQENGTKVKITAVLKPAFQNTHQIKSGAKTEWDLDIAGKACVDATPEAPTVTPAATCGKPGIVNIPESDIFSYTQTATGTKVHVVAELKDTSKYQLAAGAKAEWDLDIAGRLCVVDPTTPNPGTTGPGEMLKPYATPQAPTVQDADKCGNPGKVVIPESKLFSYTQTATGTKVHVVAELKDTDHYQLADEAKLEWDLDIAGKACPTPKPGDNTGGNGGAGTAGGAGNKANGLPRTGAAAGIMAVMALLAVGAGSALRRKFAA